MKKDMVTELTIKNWVEDEKNLTNLLVEIQEMTITTDEQAEIAFHKISELFNIPKNPEDINDSDDYSEDSLEQTSVYEQLGLIKFLNPDDDLRGDVLMATYFVKNGYFADLDSVIKKYKKINKAEISGIGFTKENSKVELVFVRKGESWFDLGCKLFIRNE